MENKIIKTIVASTSYEFKEKGSKFLAYLYPIETIEEFKINLNNIKLLHPKATHHCFAYRLGFDKTIFRSSDDGEPSGSAGKPILGAIDSMQLSNILVVVVRYYGGTMLGIPGLINAYKTTAKMALESAILIDKEEMQLIELEFDYSLTNTINQTLAKLDVVHFKTENLLFCNKQIKIPFSKVNQALELFEKIHNLVFRKL